MSAAPAPGILLVEDERQQREMLALMFSAAGYAVDAVPSAEEALARLRGHPPGIVVTDVKLTGMDGFTLFETALADPASAGIPFVFITGYNDDGAIARVRALGAAGYVTKPYDLGHLLEVVGAILPAA